MLLLQVHTHPHQNSFGSVPTPCLGPPATPLTLLAHQRHQEVLLLLTGLAQRDVPVPMMATAVAGQYLLHQGQEPQPPVLPEYLLQGRDRSSGPLVFHQAHSTFNQWPEDPWAL